MRRRTAFPGSMQTTAIHLCMATPDAPDDVCRNR
jgi:hypothetical protein